MGPSPAQIADEVLLDWDVDRNDISIQDDTPFKDQARLAVMVADPTQAEPNRARRLEYSTLYQMDTGSMLSSQLGGGEFKILTPDAGRYEISNEARALIVDLVNNHNDSLPASHALKGCKLRPFKEVYGGQTDIRRILINNEQHIVPVELTQWFDDMEVVVGWDSEDHSPDTTPVLELNMGIPTWSGLNIDDRYTVPNILDTYVQDARYYIASKYGLYTEAQVASMDQNGLYDIMIGDYEGPTQENPHFGYETAISCPIGIGNYSWSQYYKIRNYSPVAYRNVPESTFQYFENQMRSVDSTFSLRSADWDDRAVADPDDLNKLNRYFPRYPNYPTLKYLETANGLTYARNVAKAVQWILETFLPPPGHTVNTWDAGSQRFTLDGLQSTELYSNTGTDLGYMIPFVPASGTNPAKGSLLYRFVYFAETTEDPASDSVNIDYVHQCMQYCTRGWYYESNTNVPNTNVPPKRSTFPDQTIEPYWFLDWITYVPTTMSATWFQALQELDSSTEWGIGLIGFCAILGYLTGLGFAAGSLELYIATAFWTAISHIMHEYGLTLAQIANTGFHGPVVPYTLTDKVNWNTVPAYVWSKQKFLYLKEHLGQTPAATVSGSFPMENIILDQTLLKPGHLDQSLKLSGTVDEFAAWLAHSAQALVALPNGQGFAEYANPYYNSSPTYTVQSWMTYYGLGAELGYVGSGQYATVPQIWAELTDPTNNTTYSDQKPMDYDGLSGVSENQALVDLIVSYLDGTHSQYGRQFTYNVGPPASVDIVPIQSLNWVIEYIEDTSTPWNLNAAEAWATAVIESYGGATYTSRLLTREEGVAWAQNLASGLGIGEWVITNNPTMLQSGVSGGTDTVTNDYDLVHVSGDSTVSRGTLISDHGGWSSTDVETQAASDEGWLGWMARKKPVVSSQY